jgi:dihydroorotase
LLLTNAKIWLTNRIMKGSLLLDDERGIIKRIFSHSASANEQNEFKINLKRKLIIPSLVDIHCHLRDFKESQKETFETGAKAAAAGGYTHVFDMPNKQPPVNSNKQIQRINETNKNLDSVQITPYLLLNSETEEPLKYNYPYLKGYLGLTTGNYLTTELDIQNFIQNSASFLSVHCEDNVSIDRNKNKSHNELKDHCEIRGPETEVNSLSALFRMINDIKSNATIHIAHITLVRSINMLNNKNISFEVTPHHLLLNSGDYTRLGEWGKMNPPLRNRNEQSMLWKAFLEGRIHLIATDHAPHTKEEKINSHIAGVPGLETTLPLLLNNLKPLDIPKLQLLMKVLVTNPRKTMKIPSRGIIAEGEVADLTIIDLDMLKEVKGENLHTKCKWSPWEGKKLKGWPVMTIKNGRIIHNDLF